MGGGRLWIMRWVALVAAGSLLVHELRYALEYGASSGQVLAYQGHSYIPFAEALVAVLWICACLRFAVSLVRAGRERVSRIPSLRVLWASASAALIAVYTLQEAIEGALVAGHPGGLIGIYGNGGWTALLIAAVAGGVIALLVRGSHRAIELLAERRRPAHPRRRAERGRWPTTTSRVPLPRRDVIAANLAGRAPPAAA